MGPRLLLSESSSMSHLEIVWVHFAENQFLRVCGAECTISSAYYPPRTVLDVFVQVTSLNPPLHPVREGRYHVHFTHEKTVIWRDAH